MKRIPEPELMDAADQARAYAEADFEESNTLFLSLFRERFGEALQGTVLDLGCGPGDIALRFARAHPEVEVHGIDGADAMLAFGRKAALDDPAIGQRVQFHCVFLPSERLPADRYDTIISNSLLHHLHEPRVLWDTIRRFAAPDAPVLVMDLRRPGSKDAARAIVEEYAAGEPEVLREDFYNSLLAAFEPGEVRAQLAACGLDDFEVVEVSDRHLAVWGRVPAGAPESAF